MTIPPLYLTNNTLRVDNAMLEDWQTCPRLCAFKHAYKRVRAGTVAARDMGKAWHAGMASYYEDAYPTQEDIEIGYDKLRLTTAKITLESSYTDLELPEGDHRTLGRMLTVLEKYAEHWSPEQFVPLAVECPMEFELGEIDFPLDHDRQCYDANDTRSTKCKIVYQGRMDLLVQWTDEATGGAGQILVVDTKTMQQWEDSKKQTEYRRSAQLKGYMWLVQKICEAGLWRKPMQVTLAGDEGIREITTSTPWMDSILRDDIQPSLVYGYMYNAVIVRAESTKSKTPTPREEFKRLRFWPSQADLEEWRLNTLAMCADMLAADASGRWPEHHSSCASQWGRPCSHIEVCDAPPEQRELGLSLDLFMDNEWDPMVKEQPAPSQE